MSMTILTGAAGRARATLDPLVSIGGQQLSQTRALINSARGDVVKALGQPRASAFLAEMHASARTIHHGAEPMHGVGGILGGLFELEQAAARTAMRRVAIGGVAIAAGVLGAAWLTGRGGGGGDGQPMAPGPIGDSPARGDRSWA